MLMQKGDNMKNIPTWTIVMIGLVFNISSALVTHFFIEEKSETLTLLNMDIAKNNNEIELLWSQMEGIEQKRDTLLLLIQQGEINPGIGVVLSSIFSAHLQQKLTVKDINNIELINNKINQYQQLIRDQIDLRFLTNLDYTELENKHKKSISSLRNWSIFLQMIGLSLILARDLSRGR